MIEQV